MRDAFDRELMGRLLKALMLAKDEEELGRLLWDVCTIRELQNMGERLEVARLLRQGATFADVAERVQVSTATISRVNRALRYGEGGYELALSRMEETDE